MHTILVRNESASEHGGDGPHTGDSDQRRRLFMEIVRFIAATDIEQEIRLSGKVPTVDEFRDLRRRASAVGVVIATLEYNVPPLYVRAIGLTFGKGTPTKCEYQTRFTEIPI